MNIDNLIFNYDQLEPNSPFIDQPIVSSSNIIIEAVAQTTNQPIYPVHDNNITNVSLRDTRLQANSEIQSYPLEYFDTNNSEMQQSVITNNIIRSYNEVMNDSRFNFDEFQNNPVLNVPVSNNSIATQTQQTMKIVRQPPNKLINPTEMSRQCRNRSNNNTTENTRLSTLPITYDNINETDNNGISGIPVITKSVTTQPVDIIPNNQRQPIAVFGFGNTMNQFLLQQERRPRATPTFPRVEIVSIPDLESDSNYNGESKEDTESTITIERNNNQVQRDEDGWINFTTALGSQEVLNLIREDQARNTTSEIILDRDTNIRGNLDDMYFDHETGDEIRRINGVWRNIAQEVNVRPANIVPSVRDTDRRQNLFPVVYDPENEQSFYLENGQLRPLTIDTQADTENVRDYLLRTINNSTAVTHKMRTNTFTDDIPETVPPVRRHINNNREQLSENLDTNRDLGYTINTMATRQQTTSQIPTIPTPNTTSQRPPRQEVVVPAIPTQLTNPNGVTTYPPIPTIPIRQPVPTNPVQPRVPVVPRVNAGINLPQIDNLVVPAVRPVTMVIRKPVIETPRMDNPYLRLPRPVLDAIAQERDINLIGTNSERAEQLFEFDNIMPEWIQSILTKTIDNFQVLTGSKLYVFGAVNGVTFEGTGGLNNRGLMNYIRVFILTSIPNHPGREFLPALVNDLGRHLLEIFAGRLNIPHDNLRFIRSEELRRAVITGQINHIANDTIAIVAQRYNTLRNHKYSHLLDELYDINGHDELLINAARTEAHPMESVIIGLDNYTSKEISDTFGMTIPLSFANNIEQYIRTNIVAYANILTRGTLDPIPVEVMVYMPPDDVEQYINKLTDNEIFTNIGIYVPYSSRLELVRNTASAITRPQFMYPAIRNQARSHNKDTVINFTDITDLNIFMVCYGTALKYFVYEVDELTGAFYRDDDTGAMEFRRPENIRTKFTVQDIEGLRRLLSCFEPTQDITNLINTIDEGLIDANEKIAYDDIARSQLRNFDKPTKDLIQQFLRQVFYIGMYMRRWQGPGTAYPLRTDTTRNKKEPDAKVTEQLGIGIELLKSMGPLAHNFCFSLKICEYNGQGNIDHGRATFNREWDAVIEGSQCIRMASSKFVGTGYHYLRSLFRETIPGIDVKAIDHIV